MCVCVRLQKHLEHFNRDRASMLLIDYDPLSQELNPDQCIIVKWVLSDLCPVFDLQLLFFFPPAYALAYIPFNTCFHFFEASPPLSTSSPGYSLVMF